MSGNHPEAAAVSAPTAGHDNAGPDDRSPRVPPVQDLLEAANEARHQAAASASRLAATTSTDAQLAAFSREVAELAARARRLARDVNPGGSLLSDSVGDQHF